MPVLIAMMGLGIDIGIMYAIKARLQMACDGASVAALRSLSLAQTTGAQTTAATSTATQWFNANFAGNYLGATATATPTVTVTDDNTNHIRTVSVTSSTNAPSYFMKLWGNNGTTISSLGQASRRDVVIMLVLDRSNSMNNASNSYNGETPCQVMVQSAKQFTGMFQQGRDNIGLISFAETVQIASSPTTTFQSTLGYSNATGNSAGLLDQIASNCSGGTNTATAVSLGWNEIYKMQLPGALNVLVVFTDGQPTAGTFNYIVPASQDPTGKVTSAFTSASTCLDSTGKSIKSGGDMINKPRNWIISGREANSGTTVSFGANSYYSALSGPISAMYGDGTALYGGDPFFVPSGSGIKSLENVSLNSTEAAGCTFASSDSPTSDIGFVPPSDVFGNSSTGYITSGLSTTFISSANRLRVDKTTVSNLVFNLTDNAANWARTSHVYTNGVTQPGTLIYTIGLGGNGGVDFTLLQRMANDPNADPNGNYSAYPDYNTAQPIGTFVYSANTSDLQSAFLKLASVILRISR